MPLAVLLDEQHPSQGPHHHLSLFPVMLYSVFQAVCDLNASFVEAFDKGNEPLAEEGMDSGKPILQEKNVLYVKEVCELNKLCSGEWKTHADG